LIYKGKIIPGTIRTLINLMEKCETIFEKFGLPFLCIQAGKDKLVDPSLAEELKARSPSTDKEVLVYPDAWHNIYLE